MCRHTPHAATTQEPVAPELSRTAPRRRRRPLDTSAALLRSHLTPLPAQLHAPFGRHLPEPVEGFAHPLLLFRRHGLELLPPLAQLLALLRGHGAPLSKALLGTRALRRRHRDTNLAKPRE